MVHTRWWWRNCNDYDNDNDDDDEDDDDDINEADRVVTELPQIMYI